MTCYFTWKWVWVLKEPPTCCCGSHGSFSCVHIVSCSFVKRQYSAVSLVVSVLGSANKPPLFDSSTKLPKTLPRLNRCKVQEPPTRTYVCTRKYARTKIKTSEQEKKSSERIQLQPRVSVFNTHHCQGLIVCFHLHFALV